MAETTQLSDPTNRIELLKVLRELPEAMADVEREVFRHADDVQTCKEAMTNQEDYLLLLEPDRLTGKHPLDGKNEKTREAQMREHTKNSRMALETADRRLRASRGKLKLLEDRFSAYKRIADLLAASEFGQAVASAAAPPKRGLL